MPFIGADGVVLSILRSRNIKRPIIALGRLPLPPAASCPDLIQHILQFLKHQLIFKPDHFDPKELQEKLPLLIVKQSMRAVVIGAIKLNP